MSGNNRICKVCGTEYYFCPTCGKPAPSWRKLYDKECCMKAYNVLGAYYYGDTTVAEAKAAYDACESPIVNENLLGIVDKMKKELSEAKPKIKFDIVNESMK